MASRDLKDLHPDLRAKVPEFLERCSKAGIEVLIYCTYRPLSEQMTLFKWGRTILNPNTGPLPRRPLGAVVTWTKSSPHNHTEKGKPASLAFDCVPMVHGKAAWNGTEAYKTMGRIGQEIGLEWGGSWKSKDTPHFQLRSK